MLDISWPSLARFQLAMRQSPRTLAEHLDSYMAKARPEMT